MPRPTSLLQGTLDLLILRALSPPGAPWPGRRPPRRTDHAGNLPGETRLALPGPPSPGRGGMARVIMGRLRQQPRAKYYRLTKTGRQQLESETGEWKKISVAITSALQAT